MNVEQFRAKVEGFLARQGMTPTEFGRQFASDPSFVFELREGREPREATRARVIEAMSVKPSQQERAAG